MISDVSRIFAIKSTFFQLELKKRLHVLVPHQSPVYYQVYQFEKTVKGKQAQKTNCSQVLKHK